MKRDDMPLPLIRRCGCLSLRTACLILCIISTVACVVNIAVGSWELSHHHTRSPEDNLISMSNGMFSTLSAVVNVVALFGIFLNRPGNLQLSVVFNSVFILCIFLVAVVKCIFRLDQFLQQPEHVALIVFLLLAGAAYSVYYLMVVNSLYRLMKMTYGDSTIPI